MRALSSGRPAGAQPQPCAEQAEFTNRIKIWADATGRVIRIKLELSTGTAAVDQAINDALQGLQLQEPPPGDMPMPILMKISARRRT